MMDGVEDARSLRFAQAVQELRVAARVHGWRMPSFRSPPGVPGALRTLRRRPDGSFVVAVVLHGRPWEDVLADLVDGVIAANGLTGPAAQQGRRVLQRACHVEGVIATVEMPHAA